MMLGRSSESREPHRTAGGLAVLFCSIGENQSAILQGFIIKVIWVVKYFKG